MGELERDALVRKIEELALLAEERSGNDDRLDAEVIAYRDLRFVQHLPREKMREVADALIRHLGIGNPIRFRSSPSSGGSADPLTLVFQLVARARFGQLEGALERLEQACLNNEVELTEVVALWGMHPTQEIELRDGIALIPLSSLAASQPRDILLGLAEGDIEDGGFHVRAHPTSALVHTFRFSPVLPSPGDELAPSQHSKLDYMLEIARCLSLLVDRPVRHIGHWFQATEDNVLWSDASGWGGQAVMWGDQFLLPEEDISASVAKNLVDGYFELGRPGRVRVCLDRINIARTRQNLEDRAIDLGVAIEALLFDPNDDHGEVSLKFRYRGAVLGASDPAERKVIFALLNRLYSLRSMAAHGQVFSDAQGDVEGDLDRGIRLAVDLVQKVLVTRFLPSAWNGLILGWN